MFTSTEKSRSTKTAIAGTLFLVLTGLTANTVTAYNFGKRQSLNTITAGRRLEQKTGQAASVGEPHKINYR
jgi:hypothetical protein